MALLCCKMPPHRRREPATACATNSWWLIEDNGLAVRTEFRDSSRSSEGSCARRADGCMVLMRLKARLCSTKGSLLIYKRCDAEVELLHFHHFRRPATAERCGRRENDVRIATA